MMCQRMGRPPISTMGFGRTSVSSRRRVPWPPQRMTTFMLAAPPRGEVFGQFDAQHLEVEALNSRRKDLSILNGPQVLDQPRQQVWLCQDAAHLPFQALLVAE